MKSDSFFHNLVGMLHFYLSLIYGWKFYVDGILPFCPITGMKHGVDPAFAMYMLNIVAFSTLIYVGSKPFVLLAEYLVERVFKLLEGWGNGDRGQGKLY